MAPLDHTQKLVKWFNLKTVGGIALSQNEVPLTSEQLHHIIDSCRATVSWIEQGYDHHEIDYWAYRNLLTTYAQTAKWVIGDDANIMFLRRRPKIETGRCVYFVEIAYSEDPETGKIPSGNVIKIGASKDLYNRLKGLEWMLKARHNNSKIVRILAYAQHEDHYQFEDRIHWLFRGSLLGHEFFTPEPVVQFLERLES